MAQRLTNYAGTVAGTVHVRPMGLAFAMVIALAPLFLRAPAAHLAVSPAVSALSAGGLFGLAAWPVLASIGERAPLSKAVLCGLSVAQGMLVPRGRTLPGWLTSLLVFLLLAMYFRAVEQ